MFYKNGVNIQHKFDSELQVKIIEGLLLTTLLLCIKVCVRESVSDLMVLR